MKSTAQGIRYQEDGNNIGDRDYIYHSEHWVMYRTEHLMLILYVNYT